MRHVTNKTSAKQRFTTATRRSHQPPVSQVLQSTVRDFKAKLKDASERMKRSDERIVELEEEKERLMARCKELVQQGELTSEVSLAPCLMLQTSIPPLLELHGKSKLLCCPFEKVLRASSTTAPESDVKASAKPVAVHVPVAPTIARSRRGCSQVPKNDPKPKFYTVIHSRLLSGLSFSSHRSGSPFHSPPTTNLRLVDRNGTG